MRYPRMFAALAMVAATLLGPAATGQSFSAVKAKPPDRSCYFVQGDCVPGHGAMGQGEDDTFQFHGTVVAGWDPARAPIPKAMWKLVRVDESRVASVSVLPPGADCLAYYALVKNVQGVPGELWCFDGRTFRLLWEMTDSRHGRFWERLDGGGLQPGLLLFDNKLPGGRFFLNDVMERYFHCEGNVPVRDQDVEVMDFNTALGPFDLSTPQARRRTIKMLRAMEIVPGYVPDALAVPPEWLQGLWDIDRPRSAVPISLELFEGHWGDTVCGDPAHPESCRSHGRELFWFLRLGDTSGGLVRWLYQEWDGAHWITRDGPADGGIGTVSAFVVEDEPVFAKMPCEQ